MINRQFTNHTDDLMVARFSTGTAYAIFRRPGTRGREYWNGLRWRPVRTEAALFPSHVSALRTAAVLQTSFPSSPLLVEILPIF